MTSPIQPEFFHFLEDLSDNNNREWFAENKPRYESDVRQPALELIRQLAVPLKRSAPMLRVIDKTQGGSLMRIYRDTRFSKDKTPYKTNVGISMRHDACFTGTLSEDIYTPGGYVHLSPEECFVGMAFGDRNGSRSQQFERPSRKNPRFGCGLAMPSHFARPMGWAASS